VQRQLEHSLRALQIETIDLYQFHSGADASFRNDALWTMLDEAKRDGKIRHLGLSINKTSEVQAEEAAARGIGAIQVVYNRLDRRSESVHFPAAARDGLGVLARVPLASGLLSGKYAPGVSFPSDDVRARIGQAKLDDDLEEVARIQNDEVPPGVPMAQWAIAWCLKNPLVTAVIPGCRNPEQVRMNAEAAALAISAS
jgi:aryl-alcohol dehydrogenase-like predicted oxidoreductase